MMNEVQSQMMVDPETEFLASKQETGNEWELFKENVRPLKRGRNITTLNNALKSHDDIQLKRSLLETRRKLIEDIDEYRGDDPLHPWLECIKWVQETFPHGGDSSGLVLIYEQCVRTFWHSDRYKDDLRYLKATNCADSEVIYNFLDANGIGKTHAVKAQPIEKLQDAYQKFLVRSMSKPKTNDEDLKETHLPVRSFGTVINRDENGRRMNQSSDISRNKLKPEGVQRTPFHIYKDTHVDIMPQPDKLRQDLNSWNTLGARAERNKENNSLPAKWTTFKVPQRPGTITRGATASACIEVFVDEECAEETELLRANPLRNFPPNSLPR
ncbi:hypothetical protein ACFE04_025420 [Oxalis oulophora]